MLCGCGQEEVNEQVEDYNCSILDKVYLTQGFNSHHIITTDGEVYKTGNFSDGTNCKKIETDKKINRIWDMFLIDEDGNPFIEDDEEKESKEHSWEFMDVSIYQDVIKSENEDYALKTDGIIYFKNEPYVSFENEKILDFRLYEGNSELFSFIKTDKAYYSSVVKDENCYKYDDIECEYIVKENEKLTNLYNEISFIIEYWNNNYSYVLKSGKIVTSN
jgi:hypothetical protein